MDSLLWGLAVSELCCIEESTKRNFEDLRYDVAKKLRVLTENLPDPS
jgi:hypothetical protein